MRLTRAACVLASLLGSFARAQHAAAQSPPPPSPQYPPQQYPPPQYPQQQQYPPQYPPQQYQYPPPHPPPQQPTTGYQAPYELPYKAGQPIPPGYRLVKEPRYGLALGGWLTLGIPYGIGIVAASAGDFDNESLWLLAPVFGPWMTLGRRDYGDCDREASDSENLDCVADVFVVMGLIVDGLAQAGGLTMILIGYTAQKQKLVRNDVAWHVGPRAIGSGYGLAASGSF